MTTARRQAVVGIIDYQAGNLQSIENAFGHIGADVVRVRTERDVAKCTHLVLPGVGAFGFCAERLAASEVIPHVERWALRESRPLLGICVGMQLMADWSEESPKVRGLAWIGGEVRVIPAQAKVRVPHVGWNAVRFEKPFGAFPAGATHDFYFDHSFAYHDPRAGDTVGFCTHGVHFSAVIQKGNVTAVQFHPEKSQASGLRFLRSFLEQ